MSLTNGAVLEDELLRRVLSTLLREDTYGLRSRARAEHRPDGDWLRLSAAGEALALPVGPEGFQCEIQARRPLLETRDGTVTGLRPVLARLRPAAPPEDRAGYDAFLAECDAALAAIRLHSEVRETVVARLAAAYGPHTARWTGPRASLAYDALAAFRDHPVHPTGRARSGLTEGQLRRYAPEFHT
ncbi:IucA/IucC family protein, partial [Streptomyces sp. UNOC14_S4]|uniref:IucA/IucC family protein n=1 Tax=Streptomyces sp. UNOC14_S4 TaxID=2872340 RepID=UPI0023B1982A